MLRTAAVSALWEAGHPGRPAGVAARLATQIVCTAILWRALYATVSSSAGLTRAQAVSYAVLGVLSARLVGPDRLDARDAVLQHVQGGTIVYWFLRPLSPARYHAVRALGDQLYGTAWVLAGFLLCRAAGFVQAPRSTAALLGSLAALVLGQAVLYLLQAAIDVACFWTVSNLNLIWAYRILQNLLSGAVIPLWFLPPGLRVVTGWLPFQATVHAPVSLYLGLIPVSELARTLALQALWCVVLGALVGWLWHRAARRVVSQGG